MRLGFLHRVDRSRHWDFSSGRWSEMSVGCLINTTDVRKSSGKVQLKFEDGDASCFHWDKDSAERQPMCFNVLLRETGDCCDTNTDSKYLFVVLKMVEISLLKIVIFLTLVRLVIWRLSPGVLHQDTEPPLLLMLCLRRSSVCVNVLACIATSANSVWSCVGVCERRKLL